MGSDNLHHKRKAKKQRELSRRKAKRSSYDKVLIVCEGEKTEPYYFNELKKHYRLHSATIHVDGKSKSTPSQVFSRAQKLAEQAKSLNDPYDRVYCVFDKDNHACYEQTRIDIKNSNFVAITSVPCFEYWLLLHFKYSTKTYENDGSSTAANNVIKDLKRFIPNYSKTNRDIFAKLHEKQDTAIEHASKANDVAKEQNTDNPSTNMHELVKYLKKLADK